MSTSLALSVCSGITPSNTCVDGTLLIISIGSGVSGAINIVLIDKFAGVGYLLACLMAFISLFSIRRMRLRASMQKSVNVLKEENDELKENNEELKENNEELKENVNELEKNVDELETNVDELKNIEEKLREDIQALKELLGLVGNESNNAIEEIKQILKKLKDENERHNVLVKRQIITYLYSIEGSKEDKKHKIVEKFKEILVEYFPNQKWEAILKNLKNKALF